MTNQPGVVRPNLSTVFWTQSIRAFVVQLALMIIVTVLAFIPLINIIAVFF